MSSAYCLEQMSQVLSGDRINGMREDDLIALELDVRVCRARQTLCFVR